MTSKRTQCDMLEAVENGANIYSVPHAQFLRKQAALGLVKITEVENNDQPTDPYFFAQLTQKGRTQVAMLKHEIYHANN